MKISILLLIGIFGLWFFGKTQPIVVIGHTTVNNRPAVCSKCAGFGSVEVSATCPKCGGTGKSEWHFKSKDKKTPFGSKPICFNCKGTGKFPRREQCAPCQGTGRAVASGPQKARTVRADLSLWEKIFLWMRFEPNANCRPQRRLLDGSYPLVVKYVETMVNPAYNARIIEWEPARLEGKEWIIKTVIEFKDKNGRLVREGREFIVANREVKKCRMKNAE